MIVFLTLKVREICSALLLSRQFIEMLSVPQVFHKM